jgi:hypothetical protein
MPDVRAKVVIVGAGFGGIEAAKSLRSAPVEVTVIDRQNHHCFQPLLYQVATAALSPADVAFLWLPEMVRVRGTGPDPLYQQRPADFLDVPCFRHPRGQLVSGRFRMAVRCAAVPGFWNKRLGILGAIGSTVTFVMTVTIIPFMPNGWDPVAGFPAMAGNVPFLMKDVVLLAASI